MRRHSKFFSSMKQVEKRLKSEDQPPPKPQPSLDTCGTESLSSPIFVHSNRLNHSPILEESSEAAPAFLSSSPPFPSTEIRNPEKRCDFEEDPVEDMIQRLIELLGLSEQGKGRERGSVSGCECEGGFYSKIVGAEGPKCDKEAQRLEGWIEHLMNGHKMEPLRLAHLLLGMATQQKGSDFQFPSTIPEFLQYDYPTI